MKLSEIENELQNIKRTSFGISIPNLRKFAKKLSLDNPFEFLEKCKFKTCEEKLLGAFLIGYIKSDIETLLNVFENFIKNVDGWAVCDSLCQNFKIARNYKPIVFDFLMKYKNSKKEFESRIISVMLLSHFLDDEYIDTVIKTLNELNTDDYYSKMGVAWAYATIMGKYPDKCLKFLQSKQCALDNSTFNKTLQKIRESLRVKRDIKRFTLTMKK